MNGLRVKEQEERTERARTTPWFITPLPEAYLKRLSDRRITGIWRVCDRSNGHKAHAVIRRENASGGAWDCDCLDCDFNGGLRCKHIEAVRLYLAGEITAEAEPAYRTLVGPHQGQADAGKHQEAPDQTPQSKGDTQMNTHQNSTGDPAGRPNPRWARQYDRSDDLAPSYPFIQWVNDPNALEPRQQTGGFARPVNQDFPSPGEPAVLHHKGGGATEVVFTQELTVAVLKTRFAWVKDGVRVPQYVEGARGKLQALCLLRVPDANHGDGYTVEGPVMLTFTGLAGSRFNVVRGQFAKAVRAATKGKAPAYAFWMTLAAGDVEMVGKTKKSPITNVILDGDFDPDRDYIGDEVVDGIPWPEIDEWASAWKRPGPNGEGVVEAEAEPDGDESADGEAPDPADPANWYAEGTWEWAMQQTLPFDARTAKAGAPLNKLGDEALEYIAGQEGKYPTAAKAARILLRVRREPAPSETEEIPF